MSHLWLTSFCGVWETRASFKRWDSKVLWCEVGVAGCARSVCRGVPEGSALCMQRAMRDGVGGALPFQQPELETEEGSETETNSHTPGFHRVTPRTDNGHW